MHVSDASLQVASATMELDDAQGVHACSVCGRVLDYDESSGAFLHTMADQPEDHPAVPTPVDEMGGQLVPRCDFCQVDETAHVLPVRSFELPVIAGYASQGDWAACERCAELLGRDEWNALIRRVTAQWRESKGFEMPTAAQDALRPLYRAVRKHTYGAIRRV